MGQHTNISWTDSTWNPWRGCTKISPGCQNCYAETLVTNRLGGEWGPGKPRVRAKDFESPLRWNKKPWICDLCGYATEYNLSNCPKCDGDLTGFHRRRVFSLSLGDWLDDEVPIEWLADMLSVIHRTPNLNYLLLTKRPKNFQPRLVEVERFMRGPTDEDGANFRAWLSNMRHGWANVVLSAPTVGRENYWMGTSVEDQQRADERIPELLKIPARIRFLSVEPMLGPINFKYHLLPTFQDVQAVYAGQNPTYPRIHWVIFGGESGPKARLCNVEWIRDGVRQCRAAGASQFVKQLGSHCGEVWSVPSAGQGTRVAIIHDKKGGDISEWPSDLKVREFPLCFPFVT